MNNIDDEQKDLSPLFDAIVKHTPGPSHDPEQPFQMLVADMAIRLSGRLAVGRIVHGTVYSRNLWPAIGGDGQPKPLRATKLQVYDGLQVVEVEKASPGDIVVLAGIENVTIGRHHLHPRQSPCHAPHPRGRTHRCHALWHQFLAPCRARRRDCAEPRHL